MKRMLLVGIILAMVSYTACVFVQDNIRFLEGTIETITFYPSNGGWGGASPTTVIMFENKSLFTYKGRPKTGMVVGKRCSITYKITSSGAPLESNVDYKLI